MLIFCSNLHVNKQQFIKKNLILKIFLVLKIVGALAIVSKIACAPWASSLASLGGLEISYINALPRRLARVSGLIMTAECYCSIHLYISFHENTIFSIDSDLVFKNDSVGYNRERSGSWEKLLFIAVSQWFILVSQPASKVSYKHGMKSSRQSELARVPGLARL